MATIDEALLDKGLAQLERAREWSPRTVAKLEALLGCTDEEALVRVNPYRFARERGVPPAEAVELFLHATHAGLFAFDWHLLCPNCGTAVERFGSLRSLDCNIYCVMCDVRAEARLDDYIVVSFTVAPAVRRIAYHQHEALSADDFLYKLRFTPEVHVGTLDGPRMVEFVRPLVQALRWVPAGATEPFALDLVPGVVSFAEFQGHTAHTVAVEPGAGAARVHVVVDDGALGVDAAALASGRVEGTVENRRATAVVFAATHRPAALVGGAPPVLAIEPMLSGAALLTNQTFRRLFRSETVPGTEGIGVRDVSILFTDLKGSTALYERIGDLKAYALVQQHFARITAAVQANAGAVVKTIGDAVMAAFSTPADAVRAAVAMQAHDHDADLVLKVGVHRGPSIAVTLNDNLDYFGQTVNVAARVQGIAGAHEICVSDEVYRAEGVAALLDSVASDDAQLRGIRRPVRVHRTVRRGAPAAPPES